MSIPVSSVIVWSENLELVQDPTDEIVRHLSYERWLVPGAVLASSDWVVTCDDEDPVTLEVDEDDITNGGVYATFRLKRGTAGLTYTVANSVETNESPVQKRRLSFDVRIADQ